MKLTEKQIKTLLLRTILCSCFLLSATTSMSAELECRDRVQKGRFGSLVILSGSLSIAFYPVVELDGQLMQKAGIKLNFTNPTGTPSRVKARLTPAFTPQLSPDQKSLIADLLCTMVDSLKDQLAAVSGSRYPVQELRTRAAAEVRAWKKARDEDLAR